MKLHLGFRVGILALIASALGTNALAMESDQLPADSLKNAHVKSAVITPHAHLNGQAHARHGIPFIDSLVNWNDQFFADGFDSNDNPNRHWYYNIVGNPPQHKGTTTFNAPIVPVSIDLRNLTEALASSTAVVLFYDVTPFVAPTVGSPVFQNSTYSSSPVPTQFTDAVQRAEFYSDAKDDWHTLLAPSVKTTRVMTLIRGTYQFALNSDGSCCLFVLVDFNTFVNKLFPATANDTTTPIGAAENAGEVTHQGHLDLPLPEHVSSSRAR